MQTATLLRKLVRLETAAAQLRAAPHPALECLRGDPTQVLALAAMTPDVWQERLLRSDACRVLLPQGQGLAERAWPSRSGGGRERVALGTSQWHELRPRMVNRAVGRLAGSMAAASSMLRRLLRANSETVRLGAARAILELHVRLKEGAEIEHPRPQLEKRVSNQRGVIRANGRSR